MYVKNYWGLTNYFLWLFIFIFSSVHSQQESVQGSWGDPIQFGIVPVAVANLPDGRLLTWSSQFRNTFVEAGDGATFSQYFDPFANGGLGGVDGPEFTINTDHDMFCPGINNLPDGRILSAGGTSSERTSIFDPQTGLWSVASEMNIPRGYQGNVTMRDGNVFTVGGSWNDYNSNNPNDPLRNGGKDAEVWSPTTGWITLGNITGEDIYTANDLAQENQGLYRVDNHVWLWPAPNGKLFHAGPGEMMHWIDPEVPGGEILEAGIRRDLGAGQTDGYSMKGNTVMFDAGKILKTGGAPAYGDDNVIQVPARNNSFVIDLNGVAYGAAPPVEYTGNMANLRTMHNSTVLPNGEVLVTGGLEGAAVFTDQTAVYPAEIFNEQTGWRTVAAMQEARTYHSVAILMVDGRVFVGGGGLCDGTPDCVNHFSAEIYSPAYLFDANGDLAQRPVIGTLTGNTLGTGPYNNNPQADYGDVLQVSTDVPVASFSLIRFSAATHSTNNEQRRIPLATTLGTDHSLTIPGRDLLPPGYYMLFAMDANGVPSVARTLRIGTALPLANNPNLVLDMRFDEASGTTVADSSGNGNDGTVLQRDDQGDPVAAVDHSFVDGLFGNAIEFDGKEHTSNSIIDIPYDASFGNITDRFTMSAWVWRDAESGVPERGGRIANVAVLGHDYQDGIGANGIFFGFHNTLYKMSFRTNTGYYDNYAGYAPLAGWNHIVTTYDGSTSKLYANGVLIGEVAASGSVALNGDTGSDLSRFTLSGFYDFRPMPVLPYGNSSGITDEVDGRLDEVRIYSSVLGAEEVRQLFEEGLATGEVLSGDCQNSTIVFEYKVGDGPWQTNANNRIVVQEGQEVFLRARNYTEPYFIATQIVDGPTFSSTVDFGADGYQLDTDRPGAANPLGDGLIDTADRGYYTLTTADGCPTTVFVEVTRACDPGDTPIQAEYNINGTWSSGAASITLSEGDRLQLSVLPNNAPFPNASPEVYPISIILPNGNSVGDGFVIDPVTANNAGTYQFVSAQGCTDLLEVVVDPVAPCSGEIIPEYRLDGRWFSGDSRLEVSEGTEVLLSMLPNGIGVTVGFPDGREFGDNVSLGNVDASDSGVYVLTSEEGCTALIDLVVVTEGLSGPTAFATADVLTGPYPLTVSFDGTGSTDDLGIGSYLWDFGDGATSALPSPVHEYGAPGVYGVRLTVTDTDGLTDTSDLTVTVVDPVAPCSGEIIPEYRLDGRWFSGDSRLEVSEGTEVLLSMLPNGIGVTVGFPDGREFGDNVSLGNVDASDSGVYVLTSEEGCTALIDLVVVTEGLSGPTAFATADVLTGPYPLTVSFDGTGSTDDLGIGSYLWDFGDGATSALPSPVHEYGAPGVYGVRLTVTDTDGLTDTSDLTVTVVDPVAPCSGEIIPEYRLDGRWFSGDSRLEVSEGTEVLLSMLPNGIGVTVGFPDGREFGDNVSLGNVDASDSGVYVLTSEEGCTALIDLVVVTEGLSGPTAFATADVLTGPYPLTVSFDGTGSTDDLGIGSYLWDFGDGATSALPSPVHEYGAPGVYGVRLTVTDTDGLTDTSDLTVTVVDPVAPCSGEIIPEYRLDGRWFSGDSRLEVSEGTEVLLSMLPNGIGVTVGFPDGREFGDNVSLGNVDASDSGVYVLTSEEGCTALIDLVVVTEGLSGPTAFATADVLTGPYPLTVSFDGTGSTDDLGIGSYLWDFGDGATSALPSPVHEYGAPGVYGVRLTVTDTDGLTDTSDLTVTVVDPVAPCSGEIIPEYRLDGRWFSGDSRLEVSEGTEVLLSMLPNGIGVTVGFPDGREFGDNVSLGNVDASDSGVYVLTSEEGCTALIDLVVVPTGVSLKGGTQLISKKENFSENSFVQVIPNPVLSDLNIHSSQDFQIIRLEIYTIDGRKITSILFEDDDKNNHSINVEKYPAGIYFMVAFDSLGQRITKQFIINR